MSHWEKHKSGVQFRVASQKGKLFYQIDNKDSEWLSEREFQRQLPSTPRTVLNDSGTTQSQGPLGTPRPSDALFGEGTPKTNYEHGPGRDRDHSNVLTTKLQMTTQGVAREDNIPPTTNPRNEGPGISSTARNFVILGLGSYPKTIPFINENPGLIRKTEVQSLTSEAWREQQAGHTTRAQTCVHHALLLRKYLELDESKLGTFCVRMIAGDRETVDTFIHEVKTEYAKVQAQTTQTIQQGHNAPSISRMLKKPMASQSANRDHESEPAVHSSQTPSGELSRGTRLRDGQGRIYYVDKDGNEIRPASHRPVNDQNRKPIKDTTDPAAMMDALKIAQISGSETHSAPSHDTSQQPGVRPPGNRRSSMSSASGPRSLASLPEDSKMPKINIRGTHGEKEKLDERYCVRSYAKTFFVRGRIFALLWFESLGGGGRGNGRRQNTEFSDPVLFGRFGEEAFSHIRRMVVVREGNGWCWCLPINTYNGQGIMKRGLSTPDREAHSVIYMSDTQPQPSADEKKYLTKKPIAVDKQSSDQMLDPKSRLNFNKIYTVEHNVKVMAVGHIAKASMPIFRAYFDNTLQPK